MEPVQLPWTWNPLLLAWMGVSLYLYLRFAPLLRPRPWQVAFLGAGLGAIAVALLSPLNAAGDRYLFTLHATTHMLAQMVGPILLAAAIPTRLWTALERQAVFRRVVGSIWTPAVTVLLYNGVMGLWHWPLPAGEGLRVACGLPLDLPKQNPFLASLEDVMPPAVGLPFWAAVLYPGEGGPRRLHRVAMLGGTWAVNWLLSFLIGLAGRPLFGTYLVLPRLWGLDPVADQALGAGLMWVMGNMAYGGLILLTLWRALKGDREGDPAWAAAGRPPGGARGADPPAPVPGKGR